MTFEDQVRLRKLEEEAAGIRAKIAETEARLRKRMEELASTEEAGVGVLEHCVEEDLGDVAVEQPVSVLGKDRGHPDRIIRVQTDKPAEEQIVIELLHELSLAPDRIKYLQEQRPQKLLRGKVLVQFEREDSEKVVLVMRFGFDVFESAAANLLRRQLWQLVVH